MARTGRHRRRRRAARAGADDVLLNAVKLTPAGGHVRARLERGMPRVSVRVIDDGRASHPNSCRSCSTGFARVTAARSANTAAWAWGSRWFASWCKRMAARSRPRARAWGAAAHSQSPCRFARWPRRRPAAAASRSWTPPAPHRRASHPGRRRRPGRPRPAGDRARRARRRRAHGAVGRRGAEAAPTGSVRRGGGGHRHA